MSARERGSKRFFGRKPYPFDMDLVERRDGAPLRELVLGSLAGLDAIVDAGCGYGRYTAVLADCARTIIAIDHSFDCVARTRMRVDVALGICGDVCALPLAAASVDGVISLYSSAGLDGTELAWQTGEFARVTRSGGRLLLDVAGPGNKGISFGVERLPSGVGTFIRLGNDGQQTQLNLVLSFSRIAFYRLRSATYCAEDVQAVLTPDWCIQRIAGDYDGSPCTEVSKRVIVTAVRS